MVPFRLPTTRIEGETTSSARWRIGTGGEEVEREREVRQVARWVWARGSLPDFMIRRARVWRRAVSVLGVREGGGGRRVGSSVEGLEGRGVLEEAERALSKAERVAAGVGAAVAVESEREYASCLVTLLIVNRPDILCGEC